MTTFLALIVSSLVAMLPHALLGDRLSLFADFMVGTVLGGAAYVGMTYWLKKLRGDF